MDNGANPNIINDSGCTATMLCTKSLNCTEILIQAGANVNSKDKNRKTALNQAADFGQANCLEKLIGGGADVNGGNPTPLMAAATNGHVECVKLLIREGADLDTRAENGDTALMLAALSGSETCFKTLFNAGAEFGIDASKLPKLSRTDGKIM